MKLLGIDYGTKKIGVALSDESGIFAFPHSIIENTPSALEKIIAIARGSSVGEIVVGESLDYVGRANPIDDAAHNFADALEKRTGLEIHFEPEYLTTTQAGKMQGRRDNLDASAAAIILQSFLDHRNTTRITNKDE